MIFNGLHAHRLECPRANVQRHKRHFNPFLAQLLQHHIVKVQACGRRGYGPRPGAVDGLIQFAVGVFVRTIDIRRQRHMADAVEDIQYRTFIVKFDFKQRVVTCHHRGVDAFIIAQQQLGARLRRFRCANVRQNTFVIQHALDQHFNLAAAGFSAEQARRDHPGIVKDQQIARVKFVE